MGYSPVNDPVTIAPKTFKLYDAYPNPFNPIAEIRFDVMKASRISINVFDITGRLIGNLINDYKQPGSYNVYFDAGKFGLASGIYFVQMSADNFVQTRKAMLIK